MVTGFDILFPVYHIIFFPPVTVGIIQPIRTDFTEPAKQDGQFFCIALQTALDFTTRSGNDSRLVFVFCQGIVFNRMSLVEHDTIPITKYAFPIIRPTRIKTRKCRQIEPTIHRRYANGLLAVTFKGL